MPTPAQVSENRQEAIRVVRAQLGLSNVVTSWTHDERLMYNQALSSYFLTHPEQFNDQDIINATYVADNPGQALVDDSFDWSMFGDEVADNARAINPLDPQNLPKVGLYLFGALLALGIVWIFANRRRS